MLLRTVIPKQAIKMLSAAERDSLNDKRFLSPEAVLPAEYLFESPITESAHLCHGMSCCSGLGFFADGKAVLWLFESCFKSDKMLTTIFLKNISMLLQSQQSF